MKIRILIGGLILAIAAYAGYWLLAARAFKARIEALDIPGVTLRHDPVKVGGFPYRLSAALDGLVVAAGRPGYGWGLSAAHAKLEALAWKPGHLLLDARNPKLALSVELAGDDAAITAEAQALQASLRLDDQGKIARLSIAAEGLFGKADSLMLGGFTLGDAQFHLRPGSMQGDALHQPEQVEMVVHLRNLEPARPVAGGLGQTIAEALLVVGVDGELTPERTRQSLGQWRDAGGSFRVKALKLVWGPMTIAGKGDLALDPDFALLGSLALQTRRLDAGLDALKAAGMASADALALARLTLGLAGNGETGALDIGASLQDGTLFIGPVPLLLLGPVVE